LDENTTEEYENGSDAIAGRAQVSVAKDGLEGWYRMYNTRETEARETFGSVLSHQRLDEIGKLDLDGKSSHEEKKR
jgi:hypothetical protein